MKDVKRCSSSLHGPRARASRQAGATGLLTGLLTGIAALTAATFTWAGESDLQLSTQLRRIYFAGVPQNLDDLKQMDRHQQQLFQQVAAVTVGLQIGQTHGSGVLVHEDGYVLTAAHVAGRAGLPVRVIMSDGTRYRGTTLGLNKSRDAALLKIDTPTIDGRRSWPYAEMGDASELAPGSWCLALGHPGGFQADRQPVARFGRILANSASALTTDCKLVGGDSGGPLFDMEGKVIGIHSRIGSKVTKNLHVQVDAFRENWTRLARGDTWGSLLDVIGRPVIGVWGEKDVEQAHIAGVLPASPAERAGIRPGDLVTRFGGKDVESFDDLTRLVNQKNPGDEVTLEIVRGNERLQLTVILASMSKS